MWEIKTSVFHSQAFCDLVDAQEQVLLLPLPGKSWQTGFYGGREQLWFSYKATPATLAVLHTQG